MNRAASSASERNVTALPSPEGNALQFEGRSSAYSLVVWVFIAEAAAGGNGLAGDMDRAGD